jgi:hypothetical protein
MHGSSMVLFLVVLACAKAQAPPSARDAAPVAARAPDAALPARLPPAPPDRQTLIREALERIPAIRKQVTTLRALPSREVPAEYQSQEDFGKFLKAELDLELSSQKSVAASRALAHIGLLKDPVDLRTSLESAMLSQAGAYYDPVSKKFYLVMTPKSPEVLDGIAAHELVHAVQDQRFDLTRYLGGRGNRDGLSEDQLSARRFVVEGEATLVMFVQMAAAMSKGRVDLLAPDKREILRQQLDSLSRMEPAQLAAMSALQSVFLDLGEEMQKAIEAIPTIPNLVLVPFFDSYFKGAKAVFEVYSQGGWEAVNRLYAVPPASTEQVLHPMEKLIANRDDPSTLTLPTPPLLRDWTLLYSGVLGELLWRVYFQSWATADPILAAAGWDGDRVAVYGQGDRTVALLVSLWDSDDEASMFEAAYQATLAARASRFATRPEGAQVVVQRLGDRVYIVDGCVPAMCSALVASLKESKVKRVP